MTSEELDIENAIREKIKSHCRFCYKKDICYNKMDQTCDTYNNAKKELGL